MSEQLGIAGVGPHPERQTRQLERLPDDLFGVTPEKLIAEVERLRAALSTVRLTCLLQIRRAAFSPDIGVRYTETIRAGIANECRRLEDFIDAAIG